MSLIKLNRKFYESNLDTIISKVGTFERVICVFKDNAYGHGALLLAPLAKAKGVKFVAVKNEQEAKELENFFENILILSHRPNGRENPKFIYALNEYSQANLLKKGTRIHIKIDTGMHRNGILPENLKESYEKLCEYGLKIEGFFTHFAGADEFDGSFFTQKKSFQKVKELVAKLSDKKFIFHSFNSSALFGKEKIPDDEFCRVGLAQFGYAHKSLKKVLSLYAHKLSQRELKSGQSVGYGGIFTAQKSLNIANYDLGYADGLFRYNGLGDLKLANKEQILGRISMDSFSCKDGGDEICVFDDAELWAKFFNTIVYEILVKLHPSIPRELV